MKKLIVFALAAFLSASAFAQVGVNFAACAVTGDNLDNAIDGLCESQVGATVKIPLFKGFIGIQGGVDFHSAIAKGDKNLNMDFSDKKSGLCIPVEIQIGPKLGPIRPYVLAGATAYSNRGEFGTFGKWGASIGAGLQLGKLQASFSVCKNCESFGGVFDAIPTLFSDGAEYCCIRLCCFM